MKANQLDLFGVKDTPLFSGSPVRVKADDYVPVKRDEEGDQSEWFTCPECDTGLLPTIDGIECMGRFICKRCANA